MLFGYWERYADTLKLVIQADVQHVLMDRVRQYVVMIMADLDMRKPRAVGSEQRRELAADFMAGGAYMLLRTWIVRDRPLSVDEMGGLLYRLTCSCDDLP